MQGPFIDIFKSFALMWVLGYCFSFMEYSNFFVRGNVIVRFLFVMRKPPVTVWAIIWQIFNYLILLLSIGALVFNISNGVIIYEIYESNFYYVFFAFAGISLVDAVIFEIRKKRM